MGFAHCTGAVGGWRGSVYTYFVSSQEHIAEHVVGSILIILRAHYIIDFGCCMFLKSI